MYSLPYSSHRTLPFIKFVLQLPLESRKILPPLPRQHLCFNKRGHHVQCLPGEAFKSREPEEVRR